jgi:hypothetical protein
VNDPTRYVLVLAVAGAVAPHAWAQPWIWQAGGAVRGDFNDNYFFTPDARESAFVGSIAPFVSATRQTETSDVSGFLGLGANKVWGPSAAKDYVSGRAAIAASRWDAVSTLSGGASFSRLPSLQNLATPDGIVQTRAIDNYATVDGTYTRAVSERWSMGVTAKAYSNRYEDLGTSGTFQDNWSWQAGATAAFEYSPQTRIELVALYSRLSSDLERSNAVTATAGIAHEVSPQLTVSASAGGYWVDSDTAASAFLCPAGAGACGNEGDRIRSHHDGGLYGGSVRWIVREGSTLLATVSDVLAPTGTGALSRSTLGAVSVTQAFSERLAGRVTAGFTRTRFPTVVDQSTERSYAAEVGINYALAEDWKLDAGYRYVRTDYSQSGQSPRSNVVFVTLAYQWSQGPLVRWVAPRPDYGSVPGAGPVPLRQNPPAASDLPASAPFGSDPDRSLFDRPPLP